MLVEPDHSSARASYGIEVFEGLEAAMPTWRALEAEGALLTPYQRLDWIAPFLAARPAERVVVGALIENGRPIALLPLALETRLGLTIGRIPGSDLGNADWLIQAPGAQTRLDRATLMRFFSDFARRAGRLDLLQFANLPPHWQGVVNPLLVFDHQPAPDHLYYAPIGPGSEPRLPRKRRIDIQRGRRRLEEMYGTVGLHRARTEAAVIRAHDAFIAQRNQRFAEMGVHNIFAEPYFVRFFRQAALEGLDKKRPAIVFHTLEGDGEILAVAVGTYGPEHYSQYINSNTEGPAAKYSLIGLLTLDLMDELIADGIASFDFGIGDFAYKAAWTDRTEVFDALVPLSAPGRAAAAALGLAGRTKRLIKQNPVLWDTAKRVRGLINRGKDTASHD